MKKRSQSSNGLQSFDSLLSPYLDRHIEVVEYIIAFIEEKIDYLVLNSKATEEAFGDYYSLSSHYKGLLDTIPSLYSEQLLFSRNGLRLEEEHYKNILNLFVTDYTTVLKSFFGFYNRRLTKATELEEQKVILLEGELVKTVDLRDFVYHNYLIMKKNETVKDQAGYPKNGRWISKIYYILSEESKMLSLAALLEAVIFHQPELITGDTDRRDLHKNLSGILKYYTAEGKLIRQEGENDTFEYGISESNVKDTKMILN